MVWITFSFPRAVTFGSLHSFSRRSHIERTGFTQYGPFNIIEVNENVIARRNVGQAHKAASFSCRHLDSPLSEGYLRAGGVSGPVCVRFFNIIANIIGEFSLNYGSFMVNSARFQFKKRKNISYPTIIRLAIRPVPHGPDLPIHSTPDTLRNILDDLDQISHISSDSDDSYDLGP
ncbi:hypothetical protein TNCV_4147261 [Trichonephila clavipes]|nr:hypothetical protein TNCV_4147261 [Trichonephila clavipes]